MPRIATSRIAAGQTAPRPRLVQPVPFRLGLWGPAFALTLVVWAMVSLPTLVFVFFTMIPTVVAAIWDRSPDRHVALSVGGMNFAGMFPYFPSIWRGGATTEAGWGILLSQGNIALIHGTALTGWLMTICFPILYGAIHSFRLRRERRRLEALRDKLMGEWGEGVAALAGAPSSTPRMIEPAPVPGRD